MSEIFDSFCSSNVIIAGNYKLFFSKKFECKGRNPYPRKHPVSYIIKILATFGELETGKQNHSL